MYLCQSRMKYRNSQLVHTNWIYSNECGDMVNRVKK